jgi:hypothetical protein
MIVYSVAPLAVNPGGRYSLTGVTITPATIKNAATEVWTMAHTVVAPHITDFTPIEWSSPTAKMLVVPPPISPTQLRATIR